MRLKLWILALIGLMLSLGGCQPGVQPTGTSEATQPVEPTQAKVEVSVAPPWWEERIFYEIFVRSFYDTNQDGIGDFDGITAKLDYLKELGIGGIWLMPIHPSPSYHGYDVVDYYAVNPDYGTMEDFQELVAAAHQKDIRIILDLVMNHTSAEHPWFEDARSGPESAYRSWYIWAQSKPDFAGPLGSEAWHPSGDGSYYYGVFWAGMPDLNFEEPAVREEMKKIAAFWLDEMDVDGFRLDAVRYFAETDLMDPERRMADSSENHAWLKEFRIAYKAAKADALTVGEIWTSNITVDRYLQGDELDLAFNFDLSSAIIKQINAGLGRQLNSAIRSSAGRFRDGGSAVFLSNHDQNRVMSQFVGDSAKAKVAASVLLTIPGVPFIYYGEEIGMQGTKPDERLRRPMQWSGEAEAGFTQSKAWQSPDAAYKEVNVATMQADPQSLLNHYRKLANLRLQYPALSRGDYIPLDVSHSGLLAFMRSTPEQAILVLINLADKDFEDYGLTLESSALAAGTEAQCLLCDQEMTQPTIDDAGGFAAYQPTRRIAAYDTVILLFPK